MANSNPLAARIASRQQHRRRMAGTAEKLRAVLWRLIKRAEEELGRGPGLPADKLRHAHLLIQTAPTYLKAIEIGELEARISALERAAEAEGDH